LTTKLKKIDTRPFNGYNKFTGQKTVTTAFRIFESQHEELKAKHGGNASALIRLLLEDYFSGTLPRVEAEFNQLLINQGS